MIFKILSKRENEIVNLMLKGLSNQEIADNLIISLHTVKSHINKIFSKLGCKRGRIDLFKKVIEVLNDKK
jgi:ATP/maltotriose-dependent transcriptional regulator MalT